jgi:predicted transcriptional regulator
MGGLLAVTAGGGMRGFGDLEGAIMDRVWSAGRPVLVREIHKTLEPERAYTTVQTVTEILCRKGWLGRVKDGRAYRYWATVSRAEYTGDLMSEALAASGDHAAAFRRFAERMSPDEAEQLRRELEEALRARSGR